MNIKNIIKYKLITEKKKHFNGYTMQTSKYSIIFDKSPFAYTDKREYDELIFPLTFYADLNNVECNTLLERFKQDREYFFNELFEDYPLIIKNNIYEKFKNLFEKESLSVSDDILIKIMNLKNELFSKNDTPLAFITWLYNYQNCVIFYQRDTQILFAVCKTEIQTLYYGHMDEDKDNDGENKSRIKLYDFPTDYELIKEKILSNMNNKIESGCYLLYQNLQKFRTETLKLIEKM